MTVPPDCKNRPIRPVPPPEPTPETVEAWAEPIAAKLAELDR